MGWQSFTWILNMEISERNLSWSIGSSIPSIGFMNWREPRNSPARSIGAESIFEPWISRIPDWTVRPKYLDIVQTEDREKTRKPSEDVLPCVLRGVTAPTAQHRVTWSIVSWNWNEVNVLGGVWCQWLMGSGFEEWGLIGTCPRERAGNYVDVSEGTSIELC
jgi:hypothetical protein